MWYSTGAICASEGYMWCFGRTSVYVYAPPRCRTSQYCRTFIPLSVSLWNGLDDPMFDGVGLAGFKSRASAFLLAKLLSAFVSSTVFPFLFFLSIGWCCGAGVFGLIGCQPLSPGLAMPTFFNNNNNNYPCYAHGLP